MNKLEKLLKDDGIITYRITGVSMNPLLKEKRDLVTISSDLRDLKKFDVILYKRSLDDKLTLHRLINIKDDIFYILGDNCIRIEKEDRSRVIGKLIEITRNGKSVNLDSLTYKLYVYSRLLLRPYRVLKTYIFRMLRKWIRRS